MTSMTVSNPIYLIRKAGAQKQRRHFTAHTMNIRKIESRAVKCSSHHKPSFLEVMIGTSNPALVARNQSCAWLDMQAKSLEGRSGV